MQLQIIHQPISLELYGYSGIAADRDYVKAIFPLMDKMWKEVKGRNFENKGRNIWVYEAGFAVFAGVELTSPPDQPTTLEQKSLTIPRYAYFKHIGPYNLLRQANQAMKEELNRQGLQAALPCLEIYGHWTPDESKLETELIMSLR